MLRIARCRSCNAKIAWLKTARGRLMPVDAQTAHADDLVFDSEVHVSHFATCPNAGAHRTKKKKD